MGTRPPTGRPHVLVTHPSAELYGSDRMLLETVVGLVQAGWRVTAALPHPGPLADLLVEAGAETRMVRTPVLRKSALTPFGFLRLAHAAVFSAVPAWRLLRSSGLTAVYVSTLTTPMWLLLARAAGAPSVCHVHEAEASAHPLVQQALVAPLRVATSLLANSHYALDVAVRTAPQLSNRSQVVLNGVSGPSAAPRRRVRQPAEPLRLLYLGRLSERKGVLVALDAVEDLLRRGIDVHLSLVGDVFSEHTGAADALERRLAAPALAGRVERHGFSDDVWGHLAGCDVLLVPSVLPEPFGNTAVEGVLAARPVIASDIGGLPEALEGVTSARLVPPGDAASLSAAVRAAVSQIDELSELAASDATAAARRFAPSRYRTEVVAAVAAAASSSRRA